MKLDTDINNSDRITLFSILVGVGSLGLISFGFIKIIDRPVHNENEPNLSNQTNYEKIVESFKTVGQGILEE